MRRKMAMLHHRRQALGRDHYRHFSFVPARSHEIIARSPQSAPAPSPLQRQAPSSLRDVESTTPAAHSSLSPRPTPPKASSNASASGQTNTVTDYVVLSVT